MQVKITKDSDNGSLKNSTLMRGDTEAIRVRLLNQNIILDNYDFKFTVKLNISDPDINAVIVKTSDPEGGITKTLIGNNILEAIITLDSTDTSYFDANATLVYDIQMVTTTPSSVRTLEKGTFKIEDDVTQENS